MDRGWFTAYAVLVPQWDLIGLLPVGSGPYGGRYLLIIYPDTALFIIPFPLRGRKIHLRAPVILEFDPRPYVLRLGRIDPSPCVSGMIRLRVLIYTGNQRSPDMAQVDSGTDGVVRAVAFPS